jgi:hypothetical protein
MPIDCVQILLLLEPKLGTKQVCDVEFEALKLQLRLLSCIFIAQLKLIASNENTIPTLLSHCGSSERLSEETYETSCFFAKPIFLALASARVSSR